MAKPNWGDHTVFTGDNLPVMRGMVSESVDLIYLDPPFNSNHDYAAPIGSKAAGAEFKDTWSLSDIDIAWVDLIEAKHPALANVIRAAMRKSDKSYLIYMAIRLIEMKRLLKSTGSIYLHCNQFASHYLKLVMDAIFGRSNFINEIIWNYGTPSGGRAGGGKPVKVHDCLLVYAGHYGKHVYNRQYTPYSDKYVNQWFRHVDENGRAYQTRSRKGEIIRQYLDESKGMPLSTVWSDIMQLSSRRGWFPGTKGEETGYPTQKPLALLDRIIKASSNRYDTVLDPFCGCATTLVAADRLDREWVGIDVSDLAVTLVERRIKEDQGMFPTVIARRDVPLRHDLKDLPPYNSLKIKNALYGEQSGDCNGCGTHFEKRNLEVDHITARAQGGTDHIENLQLLCGSCNRIKGDRGMEYLMAKLQI